MVVRQQVQVARYHGEEATALPIVHIELTLFYNLPDPLLLILHQLRLQIIDLLDSLLLFRVPDALESVVLPHALPWATVNHYHTQ